MAQTPPTTGPQAETPQDDPHLVEHTVQREQLLHGDFLRVLRDTVRLPDGGEATREYVLHPGAVVIVPLLTGADGELRARVDGGISEQQLAGLVQDAVG